jgi:glycine oxidase
MRDLAGARVIVAGAGVLGLATALELTGRGARCTVLDPAALGDNASGVAAGMLAPALESVLDPVCAGRFPLLRDARDLWPEFCRRHGAPAPAAEGALCVGAPLAEIEAALSVAGARAERLERRALRAAVPGLAPSLDEGLFTPEDWRLEPLPVLRAFERRLIEQGADVQRRAALPRTSRTVATGADELEGDAVVLCSGPSTTGWAALAPELAVLRPIKGELLRFDRAAPLSGATLRSPDDYLVPSSAGPVVGATMEEGREDRRPTPDAERTLRAAAARLLPHLAQAPVTAHAGVRAATPDGLPLAGRTASGLWVAAGARRNGWLLAPLVARAMADSIGGAPEGPWAQALRPDRF